MAVMYSGHAITAAVKAEMERDDKVILMGEDVVAMGGGAGCFAGLSATFPDRVFDMPIAELGYTHFATGAALSGMRPIVDLMFSDFMFLAGDAIVNSAAKLRFMTLGKKCVPAVYFAVDGGVALYGGSGNGSNHDQSVMSWFTNTPGLKIVAPSNAADAYGLMRAAIRENDPVIYLMPISALSTSCEVPDDYIVPFNHAGKVVREGTDVTIIAIQSVVRLAMESAEELAKQGISAEVIDPRVISPFDYECVYNSVRKTGHLVVVQEAPIRGGFGGEIVAAVTEHCFDALKAPAKRIGQLHCPIPSGYMEYEMAPHISDVVAAVKEITKK